jgi:hypothetical protein
VQGGVGVQGATVSGKGALLKSYAAKGLDRARLRVECGFSKFRVKGQDIMANVCAE